VKRVVSARSKSRVSKRQNKRSLILANIVKESFIEDVLLWFSENPTKTRLDDYNDDRIGHDLVEITLTDDLKPWIRYKKLIERTVIIDCYLSEVSLGDLIQYILPEPFSKRIMGEETKFNLNILYRHLEAFIYDYLSKSKYRTVEEVLKYLHLNPSTIFLLGTCLRIDSYDDLKDVRIKSNDFSVITDEEPKRPEYLEFSMTPFDNVMGKQHKKTFCVPINLAVLIDKVLNDL
jgi:hypothetical protein